MTWLQSVLDEFVSNQDMTVNESSDFIIHKYIKDKSGKFLDCCLNQAVAAGFTKAEDLINLSDFDVLNLKQAKLVSANDKMIMRNEKPLVVLEKFICPNGKKGLATSFKSVLKNKQNKIIGLIGISIVHPTDSSHLATDNRLGLSNTQIQCLLHLVRGCTMKEISKHMNLSPRTIEHYLSAIKQKLNCRLKSELISKALEITEIREKL